MKKEIEKEGEREREVERAVGTVTYIQSGGAALQ